MAKKIFLDTNIVADIIDAKRAKHVPAMQLMEKVIEEEMVVCVSEDMLTTLFYISKEKQQTLEFFQHVVFIDWEVFGFGRAILEEGTRLALSQNADLEDVLQCLCAKQNGCEIMVTNDGRFYDCGLEIMDVEQFLQ